MGLLVDVSERVVLTGCSDEETASRNRIKRIFMSHGAAERLKEDCCLECRLLAVKHVQYVIS